MELPETTPIVYCPECKQVAPLVKTACGALACEACYSFLGPREELLEALHRSTGFPVEVVQQLLIELEKLEQVKELERVYQKMTFYVTVGQKYRHEEVHPRGWHPDGYVAVEAEDINIARDKVRDIAEDQWAFIYLENEFDFSLHPLGEIERI